MIPRTVGVLVVALVGTTVAPSFAYTVESAATVGCHERITSEALRTVRETISSAAPITPTDDERALIDDLQFDPDDDMLDLGAVALLLGVRDNDLKGRGSDDLTELANVHGDPAHQDEHCLRGLDDDEPDGTNRAIAGCRSYIERRVGEAIDALDDAGEPTKRTGLDVHLAIRGGIEARLPGFYVHIGQALHALQDGFTHTYRNPDGRHVTVALNWLEVASGELEEGRDGPPHLEVLDDCDGETELQQLRRELAVDASTRVLAAALTPGKTRDEKLAAVSLVLADYFTVDPGCTSANAWCDAAEADLPEPGCGCAAAGADVPRGAGVALLLAAGAAVVARRRSRRTPAAAVLAVAMTAAAPAAAQEEPSAAPAPSPVSPAVEPLTPPPTATPSPEPTTPKEAAKVEEVEKGAIPPPRVVPVGEPGPPNPDESAWGFAILGAGSIDKPGFAIAAGARYRLNSTWAFGLDGEWNPFISVTGGEPVRTGVANVYLSGMLRYPLHYEKFNMRSTLSLGTSILLNDLYGAPTGSTGLFVGADFLGVEYKASDSFYLVINPLGVAIPIPHLGGIPFLYPQYRLSLGIEFYAG